MLFFTSSPIHFYLLSGSRTEWQSTQNCADLARLGDYLEPFWGSAGHSQPAQVISFSLKKQALYSKILLLVAVCIYMCRLNDRAR